eukprot:193245_1
MAAEQKQQLDEEQPVTYQGIFQGAPGVELKPIEPSKYTLKIYKSSKKMTVNDSDQHDMNYLNEFAFITPSYNGCIFTLDVNGALEKGQNVYIDDNPCTGQRTVWQLKA